MLDQFAMWVGYAVMGAGALAAVGFVLGLACTYAYQKLLKDVPNWIYIRNAVAYYRSHPPQPGDSGREG